MKICPTSLARFRDDVAICAEDGASLLPLFKDDPRCGRAVADRFVLTARVGQGGMGIVYRAWQRSTDRWIALKFLHNRIANHQTDVARFLREAKVTASLGSPHTVTVHDFGALPDGSLYLAMELLSGQSLSEILQKETRMGIRRACTLVEQVCLSLQEAHSASIVHRDLKPSNLMVETVGESQEFVWVLDFGVAKLLSDLGGPDFTRSGTAVGTPAYMSPEQAAGQEVGPSTDIHALGVCLFEMVAGRRPFYSPNVSALLLKHGFDPPPRLVETIPMMAQIEPFDQIVQRCLAKKPDDRYLKVTDLAADLRALIARTATAQHLSETVGAVSAVGPAAPSRPGPPPETAGPPAIAAGKPPAVTLAGPDGSPPPEIAPVSEKRSTSSALVVALLAALAGGLLFYVINDAGQRSLGEATSNVE